METLACRMATSVSLGRSSNARVEHLLDEQSPTCRCQPPGCNARSADRANRDRRPTSSCCRKDLPQLLRCRLGHKLVLLAHHDGHCVGSDAKLHRFSLPLPHSSSFRAFHRSAGVGDVCVAFHAEAPESSACCRCSPPRSPRVKPSVLNVSAIRSVRGYTVELPAFTMSPVTESGCTLGSSPLSAAPSRQASRLALDASPRRQRKITHVAYFLVHVGQVIS